MKIIKYVLYLLVTFLLGFYEFGSVIFLYLQNYEIWLILINLMLFQIGQFVGNFLKTNKVLRYLIVIAELLSCVFLITFNCLNVLFILPLSFFIGFLIIVIKNRNDIEINKTIKLVFRILGILFSVLFNKIVVFIFIFCIVLLEFLSKRKFYAVELKREKLKIKIDYILVIHQIHYYIYIYIFLINMYVFTNDRIFYSLFITLGWLTYCFSPFLFKCLKISNNFLIFSFSNIILFVLFLLCGFFNVLTILILWCFSGFFSGTIVFYKKSLKESNLYNENNYDFSEYTGHILGVLSSLIVYSIMESIHILFILAGLVCLMIPILNHFKFERR